MNSEFYSIDYEFILSKTDRKSYHIRLDPETISIIRDEQVSLPDFDQLDEPVDLDGDSSLDLTEEISLDDGADLAFDDDFNDFIRSTGRSVLFQFRNRSNHNKRRSYRYRFKSV